MKPGLLIKMMRQLEADGITFELQESGQFLVKPQPKPDSPVFKFCAKNAEQIKLELWLRSWSPQASQDKHAKLMQKAKNTFGTTSCDSWVVYTRTYEDVKAEFLALMHGQSEETILTVLSRTIARLTAAGLRQEIAWAMRCFIELGEEFALADLEQRAA